MSMSLTTPAMKASWNWRIKSIRMMKMIKIFLSNLSLRNSLVLLAMRKEKTNLNSMMNKSKRIFRLRISKVSLLKAIKFLSLMMREISLTIKATLPPSRVRRIISALKWRFLRLLPNLSRKLMLKRKRKREGLSCKRS
jgi:hypothetical protein